MGLHFDIVDVFTDRPYAGNQLAVVHRARTLTAAQMQAIAAEFDLSETAFTHAADDVAGDLPAADLHPGPRAALRRPPEHRRGLGAGVRRHDPPRGRRPGVRGGAAAGARRRGRARVVSGGAPVVGPDLDGARSRRRWVSTRDDLDPACPPGSRRPVCRSRSWRCAPEAVARAVPDRGGGRAGHGRADRARRGGGRPREGHGAPADVRPAGRRDRGPCDRARRRSRSASSSPRAGCCPTVGRCSRSRRVPSSGGPRA